MKKTVLERIATVSRESLSGALSYTQAIRLNDGSETYTEWFTNMEQITYYKPFFRTQIGYEHTYFIIDIETEITQGKDNLENRIKLLFRYLDKWTKEHPDYKFFWKFSGGRGVHGIQKLDDRINPRQFYNVVINIFNEVDNTGNAVWSKQNVFWQREVTDTLNGEEFKFLVQIDTSLFKAKQMIRWVYSPYHKKGSYLFSIPITEWNAEKVVYHAQFGNLEVEEYTIPEFQFHEFIKKEKFDDTALLRQYYVKPKFAIPDIKDNFYDLTKEEQQRINEMEEKITDNKRYCPLLSQIFNKAKTQRGVFYERVLILRFFATIGYTPREIAHFIKFRINDDDDNAPHNAWKLEQQVSFWFGHEENPDILPNCNILQNSNSQFYVCKEPCGRTYPLEDVQKKSKGGESCGHTFDKYTSFETVSKHVKKILKEGKNTTIYKPTRAGVTTTLIMEITRAKKRGLFVSPTNAIARQTFTEAMEIANNEGVRIKGAVISANIYSCKKLTDQHKQLRSKLKRVQWKNMSYHSKPACIRKNNVCEYFDSHYKIPQLDEYGNPVPIVKSDDENCALATIVNHLETFDIVFITYQKLMVVLENESTEYQIIRELIDDFDIIVMDEISQFTNHKPLDVTINSLTHFLTDNDDYVEDINIFDMLKKERRRLLMFKGSRRIRYITESSKKIDEMVKLMDYFVTTFKDYKINDPLYTALSKIKRKRTDKSSNSITIVENNIPDELLGLLEFNNTYHKILEEFVKETNESLYSTERILSLLRNEFWIASHISTPFVPYSLSFISAPETRLFIEFIQEFASNEKQVIVTDATMPDVKMNEFFGVVFDDYNIGDPRNTNNLQLIIADNKNVSTVDIASKNSRGVRLRKRLLNHIKSVISAHCDNNKNCSECDECCVFVVSPNKSINRIIEGWKDGTNLPKQLNNSYFRSSSTIGVRCNQRVMITISTPYSPLGSHLWLAYYFHHLMSLFQDQSVPQVGALLRRTSARANFYQTVGRVKCPYAVDRSTVYTWGLNGNAIPSNLNSGKIDLVQWTNFTKGIPAPHTFLPIERSKTEFIWLTGYLWEKFAIIITPIQYNLLYKILTGKGRKVTLSSITNTIKSIPKQEFYEHAINMPQIVYDHFKIKVKKSYGNNIAFLKG